MLRRSRAELTPVPPTPIKPMPENKTPAAGDDIVKELAYNIHQVSQIVAASATAQAAAIADLAAELQANQAARPTQMVCDVKRDADKRMTQIIITVK